MHRCKIARSVDVEKEENMKFYERQYEIREKRYCEKYGRLKFLKSIKNCYKLYMALAILNFLLTILYTIFGFAKLKTDTNFFEFHGYILFSLAFLCLLQAIIWTTMLPFYKRKSAECKQELETNHIEKL